MKESYHCIWCAYYYDKDNCDNKTTKHIHRSIRNQTNINPRNANNMDEDEIKECK